MTPPEARAQALAESRFFAHLAIFAVVTPLIVALHIGLEEAPTWLVWTAVAWAFMAALHGVAVFGRVLGPAWVDRRARALRTNVDPTWPGQIERRLTRVEEAPRPVAQDLSAFRVRGRAADQRPAHSRSGDGEMDGDPFVADRAPVETPRLDGRAPRHATPGETE